MRKYLLSLYLFLFLTFGSLIAQSTPVDTYYTGVSPVNPTFITDLQTLIRSNYTRITYDQFDETNVANFASRDTTNGQRVVTCVYSGEQYVYTPPFTWGHFSREHSWCQSWMPSYGSSGFSSRQEYSDQHHLFPVNQNNANDERNNHPEGIVSTITKSYLLCKLGTNTLGQTVFEPRDVHKGDFARALLYMSVKYNGVSGYDWTFNHLNTVTLPAMSEAPQDLTTLIQWSQNDPPSSWEVSRNNYVQSIQGNRNPFVDHPEWVNYINFNDLSILTPSYSTEPTNYVTNLSIGNIGSGSFDVTWTNATGAQTPSGYLLEIFRNTNDYFIPTDGSAYATDTDLSDGRGVINIAYSSATTTYSFSGLAAGTTYYIHMFSYNGTGSSINYKIDGTVPSYNAITLSGSLAAEPTNYATLFAAGTVTSSTIPLLWTEAATGTQAPLGYLLQISITNSFTAPSDGTSYANSSTTINIPYTSSGSTASYTVSGLSGLTPYYFKLYSYNGSGSSINYKTDGTVPNISASTSAGSIAAEPTNYVTNLTSSAVTSSTIPLTWTDADDGSQGPSGYLIKMNTTNSFTAPVDGSAYANSSSLVNLTNPSGGTYTFTGLASGTPYYFRIYSYNGSGSSINYKTDGTVPSATATTLAGTSSANSIMITHYSPRYSTATDEFLVLFNNTDAAFDLNGYEIAYSSSSGSSPVAKKSFITSTVIPARCYYLMATSPSVSMGSVSNKTADATFPQFAADAGQVAFRKTSDHTVIYALATGAISAYSFGQLTTHTSTTSSGSAGMFQLTPSGNSYIRSGDNNTDYTLVSAASVTQIPNLADTPLPVELTSFSVYPVGSKIRIGWSTSTEMNNYGFEIQRASVEMPSAWKKIGSVAGNGNSNSPKQYYFEDTPLGGIQFLYRLKQIDLSGKFKYSDVAIVSIATPASFKVAQNYPNPFNPTTIIKYQLPAAGKVSLRIYDLLGRVVTTLINEYEKAGNYNVTFNSNNKMASGIYIYKLTAGGGSVSKKMILMK